MDCDHCGRDVDQLPYTCKRCNQQFCVDHRLPEEHDCIQLKAEEAGRELKQDEDSVKPWFKEEFRLSNVESSSGSSEGGRQNKNQSDVPTAECSDCGKRLREHEIAGCPHCGEPYCGEHVAGHRRDCEERERDETESTTTVAEHYQERTRKKQQERKTRTDELEQKRAERFSSPDVNPDGSLSDPDYEEDIQSISPSDEDAGNPEDTGRILKMTIAILTVVLIAYLGYIFVL
ncbi:AN1-type zinc finger domain-containing protein [Haloarcula sp. AONF1]|uniref:AN1-type zinc finger domain-containing protein n=1 Tax=Halorubrum distributum TaxID=29283 RepID=UPI00399D18F5